MMNNNPDEKLENTTVRFRLDDTASGNSATGPSPSFLAALTSLSEQTDYMLLPHSLHQIAETYFIEEDYRWAIQFLQLEKLYHERLLSNLASIQKDWESQWKAESKNCPVMIGCPEVEKKCIKSLNHICRTHQRPNCSMMKKVNIDSITVQQTTTGNLSTIIECTEKSGSNPEEESEYKDEDRREDVQDEALMVQKDVMRKQTVTEEELTDVKKTLSSSGLISILKKRKHSGPVRSSPPRNSSRSKVRFSESDALLDNDEVAEDSCLFFFLLCLVTVGMSMGGTMIYCFLGLIQIFVLIFHTTWTFMLDLFKG